MTVADRTELSEQQMSDAAWEHAKDCGNEYCSHQSRCMLAMARLIVSADRRLLAERLRAKAMYSFASGEPIHSDGEQRAIEDCARIVEGPEP